MDLYRYFHPHYNPRLRKVPLRLQELAELEQKQSELALDYSNNLLKHISELIEKQYGLTSTKIQEKGDFLEQSFNILKENDVVIIGRVGERAAEKKVERARLPDKPGAAPKIVKDSPFAALAALTEAPPARPKRRRPRRTGRRRGASDSAGLRYSYGHTQIPHLEKRRTRR